MSHNEVLGKDGKLHRDPVQLDDSTDPAKLKQMSDNQRYWTAALGRPDELPVLEGAVPGRADRRGGPARELFYDGTIAYKKGEFPNGRGEVQGRAPGLEGRAQRPPDLPG